MEEFCNKKDVGSYLELVWWRFQGQGLARLQEREEKKKVEKRNRPFQGQGFEKKGDWGLGIGDRDMFWGRGDYIQRESEVNAVEVTRGGTSKFYSALDYNTSRAIYLLGDFTVCTHQFD